jgi:catechol 2,3-dioxygenase-like lactoylglutathione lyase family enzyme
VGRGLDIWSCTDRGARDRGGISMTETTIHISDVHTVGIPVSDQDAALAFYTGKLGFEKRLDGEFAPGERWLEVAPPGAATSVALVQARTGGAGVDTQIRLTTTDARADHAALRDAGVDVDAEVISYPVPMFVLRDPDGNVLRIVEVPGQP